MKKVIGLVVLFLLWSPVLAVGETSDMVYPINISRVQVRESNANNFGVSLSTYAQWKNRFYFLDLFEKQYNSAYQAWHFDIYIGKPFYRNLGWVIRSQKYDGYMPVVSSGLQYNFKKIGKIQSFLQLFPLKNSDTLGGIELIHYYNIALSKAFSLRGYNQYMQRSYQNGLFYPWLDLIYSMKKNTDLYIRISYLSSDDAVFGLQGIMGWLGIRINLSF